MQILQFETFAPRANEVFSVDLGESNLDMHLVQVNRLTPHPYPGMRRDPFSLIRDTFGSSSPSRDAPGHLRVRA